jgi:hypothetical protein
MASFFQPALTGPNVDNASGTKFLINWNATLKGSELTLYWYQILVISIGCTFFVLGISNLIIQYIREKRRLKESLLPPSIKRLLHLPGTWKQPKGPSPRTQKDTSITCEKALVEPVFSPPKLSLVKTFCVSEHELPVQHFRSSFDLHVVDLTGERTSDTIQEQGSISTAHEPPLLPECGTNESAISSHRSTEDSIGSAGPHTACDSAHPPGSSADVQPVTNNQTLFYGGLKSKSGVSKETIEERAANINNLRLRQGLHGIVVPYSQNDSAEDINTLLVALRNLHVPVILKGDPDLVVVDSISFALIDGFMIKNASLLPNGQRRDFFRAASLRECVARCKRQMKKRPEFFMGFLEVWTIRPSAAALRRAFKLADFFGAVIQAQAASQHNTRTEMSLSGFDWLKRPEIVYLQKCWSQNPALEPAPSSEGEGNHFDVQKLSEILGPAENLLTLAPLPPNILSMQNERLDNVHSPDYVSGAPRRQSFWDVTSCGMPLCKNGCYFLRDQTVEEQYRRILQIQRRLKELQMLHIYADIEIVSMSKVLSTALKHSSHPQLLEKLLDQLTKGHVRIYKGLDSGFGLPDDGGHMIGLSESLQEEGHDIINIYISLKNAHDTATIWHVFLAHHGITRLQRYEEELLFFSGAQLPRSIQQELEQSTEADLLSIIQQVRLSNTDHTFHKTIIEACVKILLEDSRTTTWIALHSRACLDGSLSIQTLIEMRLEQFAKQGAHELPELVKVVELSELLERKMQDALFTGDRSSLNQLSTPLVDAYNAIGTTRPADSRLDIYGLIYFCILRKFAYEDVYLETTDRCPLFLQQHDQAGVFSELWVLGSQCEIYFGIQPRALGEITYDKYHDFLISNPPPPESWDGKDVFTAYANTEARIKLEGHEAMTGSGSPTDLPGQGPGFKLDEPDSTKRLTEAASTFGALSIFCFPAVIDVVLLSFLGRGFYLTAFMDYRVVTMAGYAILTALLMTGGITGWVGSTGGFYLFNVSQNKSHHSILVTQISSLRLTI